jgi:phospholipid-binding lipoprotein MlaA
MAWALVMALLSGCATPPRQPVKGDPLEGFNRGVFEFNQDFDRRIMRHVADGYVKVTPQPVRTGISNFFQNLGSINVILNAFLQGKVKQGFEDTFRFAFNTVFGLLGFIDFATDLGYVQHDEDLGQTLAVWGVGQGPYLMLPFLGPYTLRSAPGLPMEVVTNPLFYVDNLRVTIPLTALYYVDLRASLSGAIQFVNTAALDPYAFTREAYLQHRAYLIHDGNPPTEDLLDELNELDELDRLDDGQGPPSEGSAPEP